METNIVVDILPPIPDVPKFWFSSHGPKCCQPINLQDSLKCNISKTKWIMKYIFGMQINIKVFCKLILSFWVCATRHAQITRNKNIFAISPEKHGGDEVDFLPSHEQKSFLQVDSISLGLHLKENMEDELDLLPTDKYQRFFQIAIIILSVCCQACPNYPK